MSESALLSEVCETKSLCENDIARMFDLMTQYFDGVSKRKFHADLTDKKWVIVLRDPIVGEISGFSTITLMNAEVGGRNIKAFYSGDTIIDKSSRKPFSLEKEWTPFVFSHALSDPESSWYWFTVCKGFRTYRYFSIHFHQFWPSPDSPIPLFEKQVLDALSKARFGDHYDPESLIVNCPSDYKLRVGADDITNSKSENRYVRFFEMSNPGWIRGEELACITPLCTDNIKSSLRRFLTAER